MSRGCLNQSDVIRHMSTIKVDYSAALIDLLSKKAYDTIPPGYGECPKCHGTGVGDEVPENHRQYWPGRLYHACDNCGGQTMSSMASGLSPLNRAGQPCLHKFVGRAAGRCYHVYTCSECGSRYDIDSGD